MERVIATLDIAGNDIDLIITDDPEVLGTDPESDLMSFGRYSVNKGRIWLDAALSPSMMRSHLFHEIYEFVLGYYNLTYNPDNEHESFMRFSNVLYQAFKANADLLVGTRIAEVMS